MTRQALKDYAALAGMLAGMVAVTAFALGVMLAPVLLAARFYPQF